jgi:broad specificity phosphatase PhoE
VGVGALRYGAGVLRLLFVRHGQSEWNALGRWQGQADPPLSDLGRAQARLAATSITAAATRAASPVAGIVTSTLVRALETAAIISDAIDVAPLHLEADLVERDAGEWSGLTRNEIDERFPGYLANGTRPQGYEPDDAMRARTLRAVDRIIGRFSAIDRPATVVVVTHGGVIYTLESHLGAPFQRKPNLGARWFLVRNGALHLSTTAALIDAESATVPDLL